MQLYILCHRDEQHSPGSELPIPPILTVSLSPFSVSSWIRSSAHTIRHKSPPQLRNCCVRYLSPSSTCCPCTTFCRSILATSSACAIPAVASSPLDSTWRFESNPLRASWRAAERSRSSPGTNETVSPEIYWKPERRRFLTVRTNLGRRSG